MTDADIAALTRRLAGTAVDYKELYEAAKRDAEEAEAYAAELEAKLATAQRDALEKAAEVCTNIIRDYDVMKPNGTTYEPVHVQRAAKGMVSLAREDIRALIAQEEPTT